MKKLVIFDLDGTLLNTIDDLGEATNYALKKNGFNIHEMSLYPSFVGNGVKKLIERALPVDSRTSFVISKVLSDFKEYYNTHNTIKTKPYEGVKELIEDINAMGIKIAIASNKYQDATSYIVNHYFSNIKFVAIKGQISGIPIKPDPSIVFSILEKSEIAKSDVLYIGDSGVDMTTAWRACIDSAGVTWGFRPTSELKDNHATYIVNEANQILDIIRGINLVTYFNK